MPITPHVEKHFTAGLFVRDVVIGMADGLTVPFALAAGLSGAVTSTRLIVIGGLAEIAAGSIAMGLGGYLAAKGDAEHFAHEKLREERDDFMMRFELGLEEPDPKRAVTSASTIAASYVAGGFIPLSPYIVLSNAWRGLLWSAGVTLAALGVFGYWKARFTGTAPIRGASQTMVIGGLAAGTAFVIAKLIS